MEESFKYHIPEDIPANERTAFHGAAAAAAKAGKKSFNFGGKTHPVTMKKDTATKIADQKEAVKYPHMMYDPKTGKEVTAKTPIDHAKFSKMGYTHEKPQMKKESVKKESTMTFREKLLSLYEGDRKAHYKGATEPEGMHDISKSSKGAMDMINTPKEVAADGKKAADDNAAKSAEKKIKKAKKRSGGDNLDKGDINIVPGATPIKDPTAKMESTIDKYGIFGKTMDQLLNAVNEVVGKKNEGSIKGSGTDRKAVLKKAFRAGEDDTRRFYSGKKPTIKPPKGMRDLKKFDAEHKDKGIQKAFAGGRAAGDGDTTIKGKARMKPQSNLPLNKYQRQGIKIDKKDKADTAAYLARTKGK